ncbi:MAG: hypothetical protein JEZ04_15410 [Spirochaetales bacterium]|nr:hypothetical protein [Spirochaetales bacterium]
MTYEYSFGNRIKCTDAEKKHSLKLIKEILDQSKKARSSGFIVLGQNADSISNSFLRDSIKLVGKGYDYSAVDRLLEIKIAVRNADGILLLEMSMIREGVLSILRGDPAGLTEEILFSFLGSSIYESHQKIQSIDHERYVEQLSKAEKKSETSPGSWFLGARDNEISFLLKAFDWESLKVLVANETDGVKYRIYSNLSSEAGKLFRERIQGCTEKEPKVKMKAEARFNSIIEKINSENAVSR